MRTLAEAQKNPRKNLNENVYAGARTPILYFLDFIPALNLELQANGFPTVMTKPIRGTRGNADYMVQYLTSNGDVNLRLLQVGGAIVLIDGSGPMWSSMFYSSSDPFLLKRASHITIKGIVDFVIAGMTRTDGALPKIENFNY